MIAYFGEYKCGCVSRYKMRKQDVLEYCGKHGDERRFLHRATVNADDLRQDKKMGEWEQ